MTPSNVAQALFELARNKSDAEIDALLDRTHKLLERHGQLHMLPQILEALEKLEHQAGREQKPILTVARADDARDYRDEIAHALGKLGTEQEHTTVVDAHIVGGYSLEYAGKRIDATYKRSLLQLYNLLAEA